ncbi:C40 family peptidase [Paenalkalicoccus suaedae]|uniref:C40 family peptidase n=1 Tax=Paenalkalicoccus suaedae TaxID=2592382 RepID=A0A859FC16_9BACI|nr:NlpC/P60 family protein [Paenalkalicoccus suaedae]QKS70368.1 C40 family peptidase [Paenalkalicoccus suaedae]
MKRWFIAAVAFVFAFVPFFENNEVHASSIADQVISAGNSQLGTPYRWGGTTTSGFDCSGFTRYAFGQAGISLPRTAAQQYQVGTPVSRSNLQRGDMVFFNTGSGISHVGIYVGGNQFIHSASSRGVSIASMSNTYWSPRYVGAKRVIQEEVQVAAASYEEVDVAINGSSLSTDQSAVLTNNGSTLVPMRAIFEELGANVDFNNASKTVRGTQGNTTISLTIGNSVAYTSTSSVQLNEPAQIVNGRTLVPLRVVAEAFGASVNWNAQTRSVSISH